MKDLFKTMFGLTLCLFFVNFSPATSAAGEENDDKMPVMTTVGHVDLVKYAGVWYEYARIPNSFQNDCLQNTTATYRLREDGKIQVTNRCIDADADTIVANGIAQVVDTATPSKLEVSFVRILGFNLFWGDYWIIGLAEDYRYAIVGEPSRKYGWILSRTPALSEEDYDFVKKILTEQGYDPADFILSKNVY